MGRDAFLLHASRPGASGQVVGDLRRTKSEWEQLMTRNMSAASPDNPAERESQLLSSPYAAIGLPPKSNISDLLADSESARRLAQKILATPMFAKTKVSSKPNLPLRLMTGEQASRERCGANGAHSLPPYADSLPTPHPQRIRYKARPCPK